MVRTARKVHTHVATLMSQQQGPNPQLMRAGPLVIIGQFLTTCMSGQPLLWRASYGLSVGPFTVAVNHYRQFRVFLSPAKAAAHIFNV